VRQGCHGKADYSQTTGISKSNKRYRSKKLPKKNLENHVPPLNKKNYEYYSIKGKTRGDIGYYKEMSCIVKLHISKK